MYTQWRLGSIWECSGRFHTHTPTCIRCWLDFGILRVIFQWRGMSIRTAVLMDVLFRVTLYLGRAYHHTSNTPLYTGIIYTCTGPKHYRPCAMPRTVWNLEESWVILRCFFTELWTSLNWLVQLSSHCFAIFISLIIHSLLGNFNLWFISPTCKQIKSQSEFRDVINPGYGSCRAFSLGEPARIEFHNLFFFP